MEASTEQHRVLTLDSTMHLPLLLQSPVAQKITLLLPSLAVTRMLTLLSRLSIPHVHRVNFKQLNRLVYGRIKRRRLNRIWDGTVGRHRVNDGPPENALRVLTATRSPLG